MSDKMHHRNSHGLLAPNTKTHTLYATLGKFFFDDSQKVYSMIEKTALL